MKPIILASASPRRREICTLLGLDFTIQAAENEPPLDPSLLPAQAVRYVAAAKAREVFAKNPSKIILGADTAIVCGGRIFGKPSDKPEAFQMLRELSGKAHTVMTGVCILSPQKQVCFTDTALVEFFPLTDEEITAYIQTGEPMDKAGAYGIQGTGARFIKHIEGDFYTVMGLPCGRLYQELKEFSV